MNHVARLNPDGSLTMSLPIPDRAISPNARRGQSRWAAIKKSMVVKQHRKLAMSSTLYAVNIHGVDSVKWVGYSLSFFFKTAAFRDDDNADASCKAYRDGCAQALGVDDRTLKKIRLSTHAKDSSNPRVEFTLHRSL